MRYYTIVVFTAYHGDFMGQNRLVRNGMFLYDSLLHAPMIAHARVDVLLSESRPPELYRMNDGWIERENVAERAEHAAVRRDMEQKLWAFWRW
jgi:hypothetical protein